MSEPLNAGMPPPPLVTWARTFSGSSAASFPTRFGPPFAPVPFVPWQPAQLSFQTDAPASALPSPSFVGSLGVCPA